MAITRRAFGLCALARTAAARERRVPTVLGPTTPSRLGLTLMHEHVMVDFIGADQVSPFRYSRDEVFRIALPKLLELRKRGCRTLVECTPAYLGRDPELLSRLSAASRLHILTNTGYYAAGKHKYVPSFVNTES